VGIFPIDKLQDNDNTLRGMHARGGQLVNGRGELNERNEANQRVSNYGDTKTGSDTHRSLRLRPKIGLIILISLSLLVLPLFFGAAYLTFPWPYIIVLPTLVIFVLRAVKRRVEMDPETLEYKGTTGLSDRTIRWDAVTRASVTVIDTRSTDFVAMVLFIAFRWISLLFHGREHMKLEIETEDFELIRFYDTDTPDFAQLAGEISLYCEVDASAIEPSAEGDVSHRD